MPQGKATVGFFFQDLQSLCHPLLVPLSHELCRVEPLAPLCHMIVPFPPMAPACPSLSYGFALSLRVWQEAPPPGSFRPGRWRGQQEAAGGAGGTSGCCLPLILGSEQADSTGIKEKPCDWCPGRPGTSSSHLKPVEMKGQGRCQSLPGL